MKTLRESLFDSDVISQKLPIEKYIDDFSSNALEKLSPGERNAVFDQLFESGTVCNAAELKKIPVDLTENLVIARRDGLIGLGEINYPCKYNFIYTLLVNGSQRTFIASLIDWRGGKSYYWDVSKYENVDKKPTWKGKVSAFYEPNCMYSVITNKKWAANIIAGIEMD